MDKKTNKGGHKKSSINILPSIGSPDPALTINVINYLLIDDEPAPVKSHIKKFLNKPGK